MATTDQSELISNNAAPLFLSTKIDLESSNAPTAIDSAPTAVPETLLQRRRQNRPGKNSFLKVVLKNETMNTLYQAVSHLANDFGKQNAAVDIEGKQSLSGLSDGAAARLNTNQKRPLSIKVRSPQSLHMTLFFGGETLCELSVTELQSFYDQLTAELARRSVKIADAIGDNAMPELFVEDIAADDKSILPVTTASTFTVKELCLFPPRRNNLVVAKLEAPPEWMQLHDCLCNAALTSKASSALAQVVRDTTKSSQWLPHVTLANVFGGTTEDRQHLREQLRQVSEELGAFPATPTRISMGGPVPEQVDLDWDFYIHNS